MTTETTVACGDRRSGTFLGCNPHGQRCDVSCRTPARRVPAVRGLSQDLRLGFAGADLHRLRLHLSAHGRRGRALVPQPGRAARLRGPRGRLPDAPTVARGRRRGSPRRAGDRGGAPHGAVRAAGAAGSVRRSASASASCATSSATAGGYDAVHTASFPYFSLLAAGAAPPAAPLPPGRRLARGLDAGLLARVPRPRCRRGRLAGAAAVPSDPAAGVLLLAPARAAAARARPARRADRGARSVRGAARPARRGARAADGRLRRPSHPGEARAGARPGDRGRARERMPDLRCEILGDGPERARGAAPRRCRPGSRMSSTSRAS